MNDNKLTDEEVWLRAYCASISAGKFNIEKCLDVADSAVYLFRSRFRSGENNERTE